MGGGGVTGIGAAHDLCALFDRSEIDTLIRPEESQYHPRGDFVPAFEECEEVTHTAKRPSSVDDLF